MNISNDDFDINDFINNGLKSLKLPSVAQDEKLPRLDSACDRSTVQVAVINPSATALASEAVEATASGTTMSAENTNLFPVKPNPTIRDTDLRYRNDNLLVDVLNPGVESSKAVFVDKAHLTLEKDETDVGISSGATLARDLILKQSKNEDLSQDVFVRDSKSQKHKGTFHDHTPSSNAVKEPASNRPKSASVSVKHSVPNTLPSPVKHSTPIRSKSACKVREKFVDKLKTTTKTPRRAVNIRDVFRAIEKEANAACSEVFNLKETARHRLSESYSTAVSNLLELHENEVWYGMVWYDVSCNISQIRMCCL